MENNNYVDSAELDENFFGPLWPYIEDDDITDVDYNGQELWLTYATRGRLKVETIDISSSFVERFSSRVSNLVSRPFNSTNITLEAETPRLRISFIHESAAKSGRCFCIRKSLPILRFTPKSVVESGYMSEKILNLLVNCVLAKMNFVICGETNVGKTELIKFLSTFIPDEDKVITVEDNPELHYRQINPTHDCVELKIIPERFSYSQALKASLRLNPRWVLLSEARGSEIKYLLEGFSQGSHGITTIHTDEVRNIPRRMADMYESNIDEDKIENKVYAYIDLGILIQKRQLEDGTFFRYIDQISFFYREKQKNYQFSIVMDGELTTEDLPDQMMKSFKDNGIISPYSCKLLEE